MRNPVQPSRDDGARQQVGVSGTIRRLELHICGLSAAASHPSDEAQRRLAILVAPDTIGARPMSGLQAFIRGYRRAGQSDERV